MTERTKGLFSNLDFVVWSESLQAFVNTRENIAVDGDAVSDTFRELVRRGEVADTDAGAAEFSDAFEWDAEAYGPEQNGDQFRVERDPDTREWVRVDTDEDDDEDIFQFAAKLSNLAAIDAQMRAER